MSQKPRPLPATVETCEKYFSRIAKDKAITRKNTSERAVKPMPQLTKPKGKITDKCGEIDYTSKVNRLERSTGPPRSRPGSVSEDKESWGKILRQNTRNQERSSNFSHFDPLRTIHFLTKELYTKLREGPGQSPALQMVDDIRQALRRIPPEVASFVREPQAKPLRSKSATDDGSFSKPVTATQMVQTPPTLAEDDTEKFQKVMEDRLEAGCRQLEEACTNLYEEKVMIEQELGEARTSLSFYQNKVKNLEAELERTQVRVQELEHEARGSSSPALSHFQKSVESLTREKAGVEETCAKLQYEVTCVKMENEKLHTILQVREQEVRLVQDEMGKLQEQVNRQLGKLNLEVVKALEPSAEGTLSTINSTGPGAGDSDIEARITKVSDVALGKFENIKASETEINLNEGGEVV